MNKYIKNILFGFLVWFIPFIVSFFFYSRDGKLLIDLFLFKSIMIIVGGITGAVLLVLYFKKITGNFLKESIIVGFAWFALNILLDLIVLVPMTSMNLSSYFSEIGLRYLIMPIMSIAIGSCLNEEFK